MLTRIREAHPVSPGEQLETQKRLGTGASAKRSNKSPSRQSEYSSIINESEMGAEFNKNFIADRKESKKCKAYSYLVDLLSHEFDPFSWKETTQAVITHLLVPFKEANYALEIKEGEFEKELRRRIEKNRHNSSNLNLSMDD